MKKSTVNGIIGLFLAVVLGAGVCCAGFASRDDNGKWFSSVTYYNAIKGALKTCTIDFVMTVKTTMASGETWSKSYNVNVADSSLKVVVSSVSLNKTSFII